MKLWDKFMKFLNDRGWNKIPDWCKHFVLSAFMVMLFYGIPVQWFGWNWNHGIQLFIAAALAWGIGILWEIKGNMSHKDIWVDFLGVLVGTFMCMGIW